MATETIKITSSFTIIQDTALADDATISLLSGKSGDVSVIVGNAEEYIDFTFTTTGTVNPKFSSANVVYTDTDTKFCVISGASPIVIKNRLGGAKGIVITVKYTN